MNGKLDKELLSAMLDNELTPDERAEVELGMTESPELRKEFDELRQVSAAVRNLPQIPAPSGLHSSVMAAVQQSVQPAAEHPTGSQHAGSRLRWNRLVGLSAAIAVVVGAAVWFSPDRGRQVAYNSPGSATEFVSVQQDRPKPLANRAQRNTGAESPAARAADGATVSVETQQRVLQISRSDLTEARIGDIIEAVDATDDAVGVIRLTVVDRKLGVEALQVLLTSQQFASVEVAPESTDSGLVAVYVESNREKLTQAIAEFRRQLDFGVLEVASPLRVAELAPETRNELGLDDQPTGQRTPASQRMIPLKPGSQLDQLVQSTGADDDASVSGAVARQPAAASSDSSGAPVRVIFVVVDDPDTDTDSAAKENGAA